MSNIMDEDRLYGCQVHEWTKHVNDNIRRKIQS